MAIVIGLVCRCIAQAFLQLRWLLLTSLCTETEAPSTANKREALALTRACCQLPMYARLLPPGLLHSAAGQALATLGSNSPCRIPAAALCGKGHSTRPKGTVLTVFRGGGGGRHRHANSCARAS